MTSPGIAIGAEESGEWMTPKKASTPGDEQGGTGRP